MKLKSRFRFAVMAVPVLFACFTEAVAQSQFDELIVFGDSLSDTGNVFAVTGGAVPGPPYFEGRFSNGPVWVDHLAESLRLPPLAPSALDGTNYAYGGAQAGPRFSPTACALIDGTRTCVPNIGEQIQQFLNSGQTLDGKLIVVQGGSNNNSPHFAAIQIADHVAALAAAGGDDFLVPNMHRLSQDPAVFHDDRRWENFVTAFNVTLDERLNAVKAQFQNIEILRFDLTSLTDDLIASPELFGLSNVMDPACPACSAVSSSPDAGDTIVHNPEEYLYWDGFHFTAAANRIIGDEAADLVQSFTTAALEATTAIPEPATLLLLGVASALLPIRSGRLRESAPRNNCLICRANVQWSSHVLNRVD